jgi:hypothetical protein
MIPRGLISSPISGGKPDSKTFGIRPEGMI